MTCHKTPEILSDYFDANLAEPARLQIQIHLDNCAICQAELAQLEPVNNYLQGWQSEAVPEWDRSPLKGSQISHAPGRKARKSLHRSIRLWSAWPQWAPVAVSLVLAIAVLMQTSITDSEQGWAISFGSPAAELPSAQLEAYLARHAEFQQQLNQQMIEVALQQLGENTAQNLYQMVNWFEEQRELDLRRMEAGFQQILDRDYQTVNSMQQLASFVQFQGELR